MGRTREIPNHHTWLLTAMRAHGFRKQIPLDQDKGACDGVAAVGQSAIMRDDVASFSNQVNLIYQMESFPDSSLAHNEQSQLVGFFSRVEVINQWCRYRKIFSDAGNNVIARRKKLLELAAPKKLSKEISTTEVQRLAFVYFASELPSYIQGLQALVDSAKITDPITFTQECNFHTICYGYIPAKKQWYFINANRLKKIAIPNAEKFRNWLYKAYNKKEVLAATVTIATTERQVSIIRESLQKNTPCGWENFLNPSLQSQRKDESSTGCLYLAAWTGDVEWVKKLIEAGANVNEQRIVDGELPLHAAALNGFSNIVELLVRQDKSIINTKNSSLGLTPLSLAVENDHPAVAEFLLNHGADPSIPDNLGYTPLYRAAQVGHVACVELLLNHNAQVDAVSHANTTPLHASVAEGHYAVAKLLLERGANINARFKDNNEVMSVLGLAVKKGDTKMLNLLLKASADLASEYNELINLAAEKKHSEVLILLKSAHSQCYNHFQAGP